MGIHGITSKPEAKERSVLEGWYRPIRSATYDGAGGEGEIREMQQVKYRRIYTTCWTVEEVAVIMGLGTFSFSVDDDVCDLSPLL